MENFKEREIVELKKRLIQYNDVLTITKNMNTELQKKNETLEIQNRQLDEDFCTLKDNHENLKKRFEILQKEIWETKNKNNKKSSMFDWVFNGSVKEENEVLKEKLAAIESELNIKISENEQIHMEIFEVKQEFNDKLKFLEGEIEKMKMSVNDKISELNSVNEKNFQLINNQRVIENNFNLITENLIRVENEFKLKTEKWKNKKFQMIKDIESKNTFQENLFPIDEYKNFNLNLLNCEFLTNLEFNESFVKNQEKILIQNFPKTFEKIKNFEKFLKNFLLNLSKLFSSPVDSFFELIIERFNFIYTNIELKTEHKGYLFACDKIRFHSFTLTQIVKTLSLFLKIFSDLLQNFKLDSDSNSESNEEIFLILNLNVNIIITLLNKISTYLNLITKYYKILLKEERKIVENFSNLNFENLSEPENFNGYNGNINKLNKDLKMFITKINSQFAFFVKKMNLLFNYDLEYNLKNIQIQSDNSSGLFIRVSENYFKNLKFNSVLKNSQKLKILEELFNRADPLINENFSKNFSEFLKIFFVKIEIDYKIFEKIKEENKHKLNYPIINLSALKTNNENLKKNLFQINSEIKEKIFDQIKQEIELNTFSIISWQFPNKKNLFSYLKFYQEFYKLKTQSKEIENLYNLYEPGVDYETAIRNRAVLKDLLEKENSQLRDRENFLLKMNEYEEDLTKFRQKLSHEQMEKDLIKMKLNELETKIKSGGNLGYNNNNNELSISDNSTSSIRNFNFNTNLSTNCTSALNSSYKNEFEEFEEFLKNQTNCNISEISQEILSDDVESGTQRSTFKLFKFDRCIPVTNFTAQIENNDDVSVIYHRKIMDKLQRYSGKVKNVDTKVLSNLKFDEIKWEYESKLEESKKKYETEIEYLNKVVKQKEDNIFGYTEQILVLNSFANDLETLKDYVRDCPKCRKFIKN